MSTPLCQNVHTKAPNNVFLLCFLISPIYTIIIIPPWSGVSPILMGCLTPEEFQCYEKMALRRSGRSEPKCVRFKNSKTSYKFSHVVILSNECSILGVMKNSVFWMLMGVDGWLVSTLDRCQVLIVNMDQKYNLLLFWSIEIFYKHSFRVFMPKVP